MYSEDGKAHIVLRNGKIYTADKCASCSIDILTADPFSIGNTKVLAAYLDGRLVYDAAKSAAEHSEDEEKTIGGTNARVAALQLTRFWFSWRASPRSRRTCA